MNPLNKNNRGTRENKSSSTLSNDAFKRNSLKQLISLVTHDFIKYFCFHSWLKMIPA